MKNFLKRSSSSSNEVTDDTASNEVYAEEALAHTGKSTWSKIFPVMAAGAGLFSEGYLQNVIGSVNVMLGNIYKDAFTKSTAKQNTSSITFVGTVLGMLVFGYTSDKWSRSNTLLVSTAIVFVFAVLATGAYGAGGTAGGLFAALTAYRFFLGFGIGGEYPAGSVAAAEATGETKKGSRNTLFVLFTNVAIDWGFVAGAVVPYFVILITGDSTADQVAAWRWCLGVGCVFPLAVFLLRLKLKEPEEYKRESMKNVSIPYSLVFKFYWKRLIVIMLIWFLYDFSAYAFGIYSATIVDIVIPDASLAVQFGWNTVINLFYIPGAIIGGPFSDWVGPRYALAIGVTIQAIIGYIMAGDIVNLQTNIAAFCVVYGLFLSFGELGPGDNIGLIASKTCATGVRGQYYGIAAAFGKVGAFAGNYAFPSLIALGGTDATKRLQYPFWVASSLCIVAAALTLFGLPHIGQDTITHEDLRFREYLESKGFDTSQLGLEPKPMVQRDASPVFEETHRVEKEGL